MGWSIAHLAIGIGVWFVTLFVLGIAVGIAGRTESDIDAMPPVVPLMTLVASVVGWLCFAYGEGSAGKRWALFLGIVGVVEICSLIVLFDSLP